MKKFYVVLVVLILIAWRCTYSDKSENKYPVVIDMDEAIMNKIDYKLSAIFDSISYIPIESKDGLLVSGPRRIKISDNYIIFFDGTTSELLLFDGSGRFIRKIAQRGKGPGEYNFVQDLAIDEHNNIIYVLCNDNRKIFKYNFQGSFLGNILLTKYVDAMDISSSNTILLHFPNWAGNLEYSWLLLNTNGDTINLFKNNIFYIPQKRNYWESEAIYYRYRNQLHVKDKCDTLFVIAEDNTMTPMPPKLA